MQQCRHAEWDTASGSNVRNRCGQVETRLSRSFLSLSSGSLVCELCRSTLVSEFWHFYPELSLQQGLHCSNCWFLCPQTDRRMDTNRSLNPCCVHAHGVIMCTRFGNIYSGSGSSWTHCTITHYTLLFGITNITCLPLFCIALAATSNTCEVNAHWRCCWGGGGTFYTNIVTAGSHFHVQYHVPYLC